MGYLPIFLYLASFIFLFLLVVNNSIKNKKKQYQLALEDLALRLKVYGAKNPGTGITSEAANLEEVEQEYQKLKADTDTADVEATAQLNQIKLTLGRIRQQQYWYNNLVKTKPYSFVATMFGHKPL